MQLVLSNLKISQQPCLKIIFILSECLTGIVAWGVHSLFHWQDIF